VRRFSLLVFIFLCYNTLSLQATRQFTLAPHLDCLQAPHLRRFSFLRSLQMTLRDGKPCKKCGTSDWYGTGRCKQCSHQYSKRWKQANKAKVADRNRAYQQANKSKVADQKRAWHQANKSRIANQKRAYRQANKSNIADRVRAWHQANPDKVKAIYSRRRTRKSKAGGSFTGYEWKQLVKHQNGRCLACGKKKKLTADHVIPVASGGTSNISNIQGLCQPCNSSKGTHTTDYRKGSFLRWIQRKML